MSQFFTTFYSPLLALAVAELLRNRARNSHLSKATVHKDCKKVVPPSRSVPAAVECARKPNAYGDNEMKAKICASLFAAMALASIPTAGMAEQVGGQNQADGRCMAAMLAMSEKSRGSDKAGFDSSMMFFMGKIVGRSGKAGLAPALGAGAATVTDANAPAIAGRCADEMNAVAAAM